LLQVVRKDSREPLEFMLRRFNKKVQISGVLLSAKSKKYYQKPLSKRMLRLMALKRARRNKEKELEILGLKDLNIKY
jgi:ribosomal protein S21